MTTTLRLLYSGMLVLGACSPATNGAPASAPAASAAAPAPVVTAKDREERANATLDHIAAKDFDGAQKWFDAGMRADLGPSKLRDAWSQVESQFGAYKSRSFDGAARLRGYVVLEYDVSLANGHCRAQVVFDDEGLVGGLFFKP